VAGERGEDRSSVQHVPAQNAQPSRGRTEPRRITYEDAERGKAGTELFMAVVLHETHELSEALMNQAFERFFANKLRPIRV